MATTLTTAQLQTLKTAINADPALSSQPPNSDGANNIAIAMNAPSNPAFTVWKTSVSITQVGDNIVATELAGLTANNLTRLQTISTYSQDGVNPSLPDRRAFFDDVFSGAGGALTRPKLLVLWKRIASRFERLYATGTGTDAVPGLLVVEGQCTIDDVQAARSS